MTPELKVALHGLAALLVRRGVGPELEVHGVAAGVHELGGVGAVDPRRVVLHLPADVEVGVVARHGEAHPRRTTASWSR